MKSILSESHKNKNKNNLLTIIWFDCGMIVAPPEAKLMPVLMLYAWLLFLLIERYDGALANPTFSAIPYEKN